MAEKTHIAAAHRARGHPSLARGGRRGAEFAGIWRAADQSAPPRARWPRATPQKPRSNRRPLPRIDDRKVGRSARHGARRGRDHLAALIPPVPRRRPHTRGPARARPARAPRGTGRAKTPRAAHGSRPRIRPKQTLSRANTPRPLDPRVYTPTYTGPASRSSRLAVTPSPSNPHTGPLYLLSPRTCSTPRAPPLPRTPPPPSALAGSRLPPPTSPRT